MPKSYLVDDVESAGSSSEDVPPVKKVVVQDNSSEDEQPHSNLRARDDLSEDEKPVKRKRPLQNSRHDDGVPFKKMRRLSRDPGAVFDFDLFNSSGEALGTPVNHADTIDLTNFLPALTEFIASSPEIFIDGVQVKMQNVVNMMYYVLMNEGSRAKFSDDAPDGSIAEFEQVPAGEMSINYQWFNKVLGVAFNPYRNKTGSQNDIFQEMITKHSRSLPLPGKFVTSVTKGTTRRSYNLVVLYLFQERDGMSKKNQSFIGYNSIRLSTKNLERFVQSNWTGNVYLSPTKSKEMTEFMPSFMSKKVKKSSGLALATCGPVTIDKDINIKMYNSLVVSFEEVK